MKKIIAVWGNAGAGKSLVSCALANALTSGGNVIVISADKLTPMFPVYLPMETAAPDASLGLLLSGAVTGEQLKHKIHIHPDNARLGFMTLVSGENGLKYQTNWQNEAIRQLIQVLSMQDLADYLLLDCTCDLLNDSMTLYALENAELLLQVLSPDTRSCSFLASQGQILESGNFSAAPIRVLNNSFEYSPEAQLCKDYSIEYVLPHARDAYSKFVGGKLLQRLGGADGRQFALALKKLTERVAT